MKSWYLLPAFVLGAFAGWLGRGADSQPTPASAAASKTVAERSVALRTDGNSLPVAFPTDLPPHKRARTFQAWIAGMNADNWRSYLDQAVSPEAMDRRFLQSGSAESLLFLRRLGEIAPREALKFLEDRKLESCLAEVAEGWALVAPAEAFQWSMSVPNPHGGYKAVGRMAAALLVEDPAAVLGNPRFELQEDTAKELYRHLGMRKVTELLATRWDAKPGDDAQSSGFRKHEFQRWSGVVTSAIHQAELDDTAKRQAMNDWWQSIANRPALDPKIRWFVDFQLRTQGSRQPGT